jgi:Na+/H+ antiporter NhaD/arsenite permease-like protein
VYVLYVVCMFVCMCWSVAAWIVHMLCVFVVCTCVCVQPEDIFRCHLLYSSETEFLTG